MLLEVLLAITIQTNINYKNDTKLATNLSGMYHNSNVVILPGDSVAQKEEKIQAERNRLASTSYQRSRGAYGESAEGYGEAEKLYQDSTNNCVQWAKKQTGKTYLSIGAGGRSGINSFEPKEGAIGVEKGRVHAVVVVAIDGDKITVNESNFYRGWITERVLNRSQFIGFII